MKIFNSAQIREIDSFTIKNEPVSSVDLMERAAMKLFSWITGEFNRSDNFLIFIGPGNNGGDGLALARMLGKSGYKAGVFNVAFHGKTSDDWQINHKRLSETGVRVRDVRSTSEMPLISDKDIVIDAIFGSGLTRPVDGLARQVIDEINRSGAVKIAIDVPSGLSPEGGLIQAKEGTPKPPEGGLIIKADYTLSFQFPKLAFMFAENHEYVGEWKILPIGLHEAVIESTPTPYHLLAAEDVNHIPKKRKKFDHKGVYGHGLLVAGSRGKMGAAILGASAALRTGIGLLTCHVPSSGNEILQTALPEAMVQTDASPDVISSAGDVSRFSAIAAGPGLGTGDETQSALRDLIPSDKPLVLDADALNILSLNKEWLRYMQPGNILTPHPKEFERLAGKTSGSFERLQLQRNFSEEYKCIVILKGAHTSISMPDGRVFFNNTGNPGMARGGSGDVLTGMLLSLLAQGYTAEQAAILGVYLHGLAGDIAVSEASCESIIASDIINSIGKAFNKIRGF